MVFLVKSSIVVPASATDVLEKGYELRGNYMDVRRNGYLY
jgi:hypothetical protein